MEGVEREDVIGRWIFYRTKKVARVDVEGFVGQPRGPSPGRLITAAPSQSTKGAQGVRGGLGTG